MSITTNVAASASTQAPNIVFILADDLAKRGALETAKWAKAIKDAKIEAQ